MWSPEGESEDGRRAPRPPPGPPTHSTLEDELTKGLLEVMKENFRLAGGKENVTWMCPCDSHLPIPFLPNDAYFAKYPDIWREAQAVAEECKLTIDRVVMGTSVRWIPPLSRDGAGVPLYWPVL